MKIKTIGPVHHDGKEIDVGTTLNLPTKQAVQLVDAGAAEVVGSSKPVDTNPVSGDDKGSAASDGDKGDGQ